MTMAVVNDGSGDQWWWWRLCDLMMISGETLWKIRDHLLLEISIFFFVRLKEDREEMKRTLHKKDHELSQIWNGRIEKCNLQRLNIIQNFQNRIKTGRRALNIMRKSSHIENILKNSIWLKASLSTCEQRLTCECIRKNLVLPVRSICWAVQHVQRRTKDMVGHWHNSRQIRADQTVVDGKTQLAANQPFSWFPLQKLARSKYFDYDNCSVLGLCTIYLQIGSNHFPTTETVA